MYISNGNLCHYVGKEERQATFDPIMNEIHKLLPVDESNAFQYRVLVPGM